LQRFLFSKKPNKTRWELIGAALYALFIIVAYCAYECDDPYIARYIREDTQSIFYALRNVTNA